MVINGGDTVATIDGYDIPVGSAWIGFRPLDTGYSEAILDSVPPTFPTTSVLKNFNIADENPLSHGGTMTGPLRVGLNTLRVVSSGLMINTTGPGTGESYISTTTYTDCEAFVTVTTPPSTAGDFADVNLRIQSPGTGAVSYYQVGFEWGAGLATKFGVFRCNSGSFTQVGNYLVNSISLAPGDKFGTRITGTGATVTIEVYYIRGGRAVLLGVITDTSGSRITSAGYIGVDINHVGGTTVLDDLGGGTYSVGSTVTFDVVVGGLGVITAAINHGRAFATAIAGTGALTAQEDPTRGFATSIAGLGSVVAAFDRQPAFNVGIAGTGAVVAQFDRQPVLAASIAGLGSLAADLSLVKLLSSSIAGNGALTADLSPVRGLSTAIAGTGALSVDLIHSTLTLASVIAGVGTLTVQDARTVGYATNIAGLGSTVVDLSVARPLAVNIAGVGTIVADVSVASSAFKNLDTVISGLAVVTADFVHNTTTLSVNIDGVGTVSATLTGGQDPSLLAAIINTVETMFRGFVSHMFPGRE